MTAAFDANLFASDSAGGPYDRKAILCLHCNEPFSSTGPGNRICPGCKKRQRAVKRATLSTVMRRGRNPS